MKRFPVLVPLALAALLLAGCAGEEAPTSSAAQDLGGANAARQAAPATGTTGTTGTTGGTTTGTTGGGADSAAPSASGPLGRVAPAAAVIRTADLEVVVDDTRRAAEEASGVAQGAGGSVESEDRSSIDSTGTAALRLRVPPATFDDTLRALSALGQERSRRLGSSDVTDQVVDLDSRLTTQRASVERVRALLTEADTLGEVVQIESELTRRTADLESLQARLAALNEQVSLSSITVRFTQEAGVAGSGPLSFRDGLRKGWDALLFLGRAGALATGAVLPFAPLLTAALLLLWRVRSRRTASSPSP